MLAQTAAQHDAAHAFWNPRIGHRGRWHLRGDGLRRQPANTGDRHPNGSRGSAIRDLGIRPRWCAGPGRRRPCARLLGAWGLAGAIGAFLFEVRPHDPGVYVGAVAVLALAGLTAATVPGSSRGADRPSDHSAHRVSRGTSSSADADRSGTVARFRVWVAFIRMWALRRRALRANSGESTQFTPLLESTSCGNRPVRRASSVMT
jgi:hypothetical protein